MKKSFGVMSSRYGFTIMELLIVAVCIVVIAAFSVPSYEKSLNRSRERSAVRGLMVIREGLQLYYSRNGAFVDRAMVTLEDINDTLNIYIIANGLTYGCTGTTTTYDCTATSTDGWVVRITDSVASGAPYCSVGTCPRCTGAGCS